MMVLGRSLSCVLPATLRGGQTPFTATKYYNCTYQLKTKFMYTCVVCAYACEGVQVTGKPPVLPLETLPMSFETVSLIGLKLTDWSRLSGQAANASLYLLNSRLTSGCHNASLFR